MSASTGSGGTCLPTTAWFLYDQNGNPLGQIYRREAPAVGVMIEAGEVVAFQDTAADVRQSAVSGGGAGGGIGVVGFDGWV